MKLMTHFMLVKLVEDAKYFDDYDSTQTVEQHNNET